MKEAIEVKKPMMYRLFVACPVPELAAKELADWAKGALLDAPVHLIQAEQMRVTILFYSQVSSDERDRLACLMTQVNWNALPVETTKAILTSQSAIALNLAVPEAELSHLEDQLVRSFLECPHEPGVDTRTKWARMNRAWESFKKAPLGQMALAVDQAEHGRKLRRETQRISLQLFVSVARVKRAWKPDLAKLLPPHIQFNLNRIALFESFLMPDGAQYQLIAESTPTV